ncbi:hypothetical protein JZ751_013163 [Albula glossodonta]|uniref:Uncharacterized protein n=1 Tax=Albula glossodonta TaxID=121402 RepID=A0A8T2P2C2_9TELE|nr:hypothetical protein JZ751_013163 [Albula glossodonta]
MCRTLADVSNPHAMQGQKACVQMGVSLGRRSEDEEEIIPDSGGRRKSLRKDQGAADTLDCPTCRGTGRIPRGQESQLVAVIPCTDQRLKPRRTSLVLFFLFPRSVLLSAVAVKSVYVFFTPSTVEMHITNVLNITNNNFAVVDATDLSVQVLFYDTVLGTAAIPNVTTVQPRSAKAYTYEIPIEISDEGLKQEELVGHVRVSRVPLEYHRMMINNGSGSYLFRPGSAVQHGLAATSFPVHGRHSTPPSK